MSQATITERPYVNSNLFANHYLDDRVIEKDQWDCDDEALAAMEELQSLYELEGSLVNGYGEDALIDNWIDEILDVLGFGTQVEATLPSGGGFVDELLFEDGTARREAASVYLDTEDTVDLFERGVGLVEAKQWDADFSQRFSEQRPYRNASHQIKHYLENTPENIQWGVLTNGRKWRLYGTKDYETQTYYEIDLPELLERGDLDAFKYFFVFFRPAAFRESAGTTFLDEVWSESETASQELGENLQDNVFTALRVLGRGFVETNNDLDIDPDDKEALDELKEQSLVFLYRLMFVLYAEARGLIHPEDQRAQDEYDQNFSLDELRLDIHDTIGEVDEGFAEEFSNYSTTMWSRLEDLFRLIDEGEEDLGIPPYNGGLFDHEEHDFLTEHEVSNEYLAEVIYRLSATQNDEGRFVLADYADLDTRHLGSVYEGLLEHQFRIAPEQYTAVAEDGGQVWKPATEVNEAEAVETVSEGGLYVVNDEGERKATGAYYTPDYVVTYIVEETIGPLVEEIREDLIDQGFEPGTQEYIGPFFRRMTDLRILDPAMGSGHFLTKATGYLSEQVMAEVREAETEFGVAFDEQHIRREIAKECIYGVDLNGMAVELAKLSMWLETLAADRPLAFLDHHFKKGNSLVGSDIEDIEELESDANGDDSQASLAEFGATREGTIERLMDIYSEFLAIENETVEDVHEMKRKYAEIEQDELRKRLVAMANVHTAERFGLDVPGGAYERMARALEDTEEWTKVEGTDWFESAQSIAEEEEFFHWKLEFPEVFYEDDGTIKSGFGFDTVLGNPPYRALAHGRRQKAAEESLQQYLRQRHPEASEYNQNLFAIFLDKSIELVKKEKFLGFIIPDTFLTNYYFKKIRSKFLNSYEIVSVVDSEIRIFTEVETGGTTIPIVRKNTPSESSTTDIIELDKNRKFSFKSRYHQANYSDIPYNKILLETEKLELMSKLQSVETTIGEEATMYAGIVSGDNEKYLSDSPTEPEHEKVVRGRDLHRYHIKWDSLYIYFDEEELYSNTNRDMFETCPKILMRQTGDSPTAAVDRDGLYSLKTTHLILPESLDVDYLTACINSNLIDWYYQQLVPEKGRTFAEVKAVNIKQFPIRSESPELDISGVSTDEIEMREESDNAIGLLSSLAKYMENIQKDRYKLNLNLLDYIQPYSDGPALIDIGIYQPPDGVGDTKLAATKEDYDNIRVGTVTCEREDENTVAIHATARYKPDDEDAYETDQWGYTETESMPAMRLTDLTETEADLVEVFVPVAVEEAGGFANFRETATKTNSLVDRLEEITLPDPANVSDDLERYSDAVMRAEELDDEIQKTNNLIDEIVYELYGLSDEEIEIVEDAVAEN